MPTADTLAPYLLLAYRIVNRFFCPPGLAREDLEQIALAAAWKASRRVLGPSRGYVARSVYHALVSCLREERRHWRRHARLPDDLAGRQRPAEADGLFDWSESLPLDDYQRAVLRLCFRDGLSQVEAARLLGVSAQTVWHHRQGLLNFLRGRLSGTDRGAG
jgi:RNA polymerase sigma factor (sigma-70 family)